MHEHSLFSTSLPTFASSSSFFFFFGDKNFHRIEVASHCDIYISLIVNDVGIFFMSVLIICIFFGIMFIQVLCLFLIMMFVFDVELCEFFIYFGA